MSLQDLLLGNQYLAQQAALAAAAAAASSSRTTNNSDSTSQQQLTTSVNNAQHHTHNQLLLQAITAQQQNAHQQLSPQVTSAHQHQQQQHFQQLPQQTFSSNQVASQQFQAHPTNMKLSSNSSPQVQQWNQYQQALASALMSIGQSCDPNLFAAQNNPLLLPNGNCLTLSLNNNNNNNNTSFELAHTQNNNSSGALTTKPAPPQSPPPPPPPPSFPSTQQPLQLNSDQQQQQQFSDLQLRQQQNNLLALLMNLTSNAVSLSNLQQATNQQQQNPATSTTFSSLLNSSNDQQQAKYNPPPPKQQQQPSARINSVASPNCNQQFQQPVSLVQTAKIPAPNHSNSSAYWRLLESLYDMNDEPEDEAIELIAQRINSSSAEVASWFQSRREAERTKCNTNNLNHHQAAFPSPTIINENLKTVPSSTLLAKLNSVTSRPNSHVITTHLDQKMIDLLEAFYAINDNPEPAAIEMIAKRISTTVEAIGDWFDEKRIKTNPHAGPRSPPAKKREGGRVVTFSEYQRSLLEAIFDENNYLHPQEYEELSNLIQVPSRNIKIWFKNRRSKQRLSGRTTTPGSVNNSD